ncbi:MAG: hypothetical protein D6702_02430 [Planctomycetota bacterium]|nr:MAG: hypothetical protein D6702_02430 [Planctomycetota bacterium]
MTPRALVSEQKMFLHFDERYSVIAINPENGVPRLILRGLVPPRLSGGGEWEVKLPTLDEEE